MILRFGAASTLVACCSSLICLQPDGLHDDPAACPNALDVGQDDHASWLQSSIAVHRRVKSGNNDNSSSYHVLPTRGLYTEDEAQYGETTAYRGKIYSAPHDALDLLIYDTSTDSLSVVSTASILDNGGTANWLGITAYEGKIYAAPHWADQILVYDVELNVLSGVQTNQVAQGSSKWNGIAAWEGKLYAAPFGVDKMLVYDLATNEVSGIPTSSVCSGGLGTWMGVIAHAGKLYSAPIDVAGNCDQMLVYDVASGKVSGISTAAVATGPWKWHGMALLDSKVYAVPANAHALLIYDTETGEVSGASTKAISQDEHKWAGLTALNGKLYGGPQFDEGILVYNPATKNVSSLPVTEAVSSSMPKRNGCMKNVVSLMNPDHRCGTWNGIAGWGKKLACPPYDASSVLVYDLP